MTILNRQKMKDLVTVFFLLALFCFFQSCLIFPDNESTPTASGSCKHLGDIRPSVVKSALPKLTKLEKEAGER
jgi:hypothetical protein